MEEKKPSDAFHDLVDPWLGRADTTKLFDSVRAVLEDDKANPTASEQTTETVVQLALDALVSAWQAKQPVATSTKMSPSKNVSVSARVRELKPGLAQIALACHGPVAELNPVMILKANNAVRDAVKRWEEDERLKRARERGEDPCQSM